MRFSPPSLHPTLTAALLLFFSCALTSGTGNAAPPSLLAAIDAGNRPVVLRLLEQGAQGIDVRDSARRGVLHHAAVQGDGELVTLLVARGADVYARDCRGRTPLLAAATAGQLAAIDALVAGGAPVDAGDDEGLTPLLAAARSGQTEAMRRLASLGAATDGRTAAGRGLLFAAVESGQDETVRFALTLTEDPDLPDRDGMTPLAQALGTPSLVRLLVAAGASTDTPLQLTGEDGPLSLSLPTLAALRGSSETLQILAAAGADLEAADGSPLSPLLAACLGRHWEAARLLIAAGVSVDGHLGPLPAGFGKEARTGMTALMLAAGGGDQATVAALLQHNAAVDSRSPEGWSALMLALRSGQREIARLLEANGAWLSDADRTVIALAVATDTDREARATLLRLRVALEARRRQQGRYPALLRELAGETVPAEVLLDYRPAGNGFALAARHRRGSQEYQARSGQAALLVRPLGDPGQPWSVEASGGLPPAADANVLSPAVQSQLPTRMNGAQ